MFCERLGATPAWYCVRTKRHRENFARSNLGRDAIQSYLPMIVEWPPPAVGSLIRPMFPGYLMIHATLPGQFHRVARTPGVTAFVCFGGEPAPIDETVLGFLRDREDGDGLIRCHARSAEGSAVRITRGPFRGLSAVLERRLPARERVFVLLEFLQRPTRVELSERWLANA